MLCDVQAQSCTIVPVVKNSEHLDKQAQAWEDGDQWNASSGGFEENQELLFVCGYILGLSNNWGF